MKWRSKSAFVNRKKEMAFLREWVDDEPGRILFIYGPKSSGKTTLLYKFVNELLDKDKYDVKFFNLRKILIVNYTDFIQTFFEYETPQEIKETRQYDLKVFKLTVETMKGLREKRYDPFAVMEAELRKLVSKGIKPIIIIDELQALTDIYMNGQRELLKELFNFFVAMTKESHLCHVIISSSDGYFIERIYSDSRLLKTSQFFEVDYLPKEDIVYWLTHLKEESKIENLTLTEHQIERIWYYFGGSMWEISKLLSNLLMQAVDGKVSDEILENEAKKDIRMYASRFEYEFYYGKYYKTNLFQGINKILMEKDKFKASDLAKYVDIPNLVEKRFSLLFIMSVYDSLFL